MVLEAESLLPVWDELEPPATEPEAFEPQEALDIMDDTADEIVDESSDMSTGKQPGHEEEARDERRGRRRRRRRGRVRSREDAPAADSSAVKGPDEELGADESVVSESLEIEAEITAKEDTEEDRPGDQLTERRGRRRRRGRGREPIRDEQAGEEEGAIVDDDFDFGSAAEDRDDADASDEHELDGDEKHDDQHIEDEDDDGGESPRIGFRNIPTWQDAIGMMIAKNMESRSRNPGSARGPNGRGGRSGGRGRGRRPDRR